MPLLLGLDGPGFHSQGENEPRIEVYTPESAANDYAESATPSSSSHSYDSGGRSVALSGAELVDAMKSYDAWNKNWPSLTDDPDEHDWPQNQINPILTDCIIRLDWDVLEDPSHAEIRAGLPPCFRDQRYSPALTPFVMQLYIIVNIEAIPNELPSYPIITVTADGDAITCWDVLLAIQNYVATVVPQSVFESFGEAQKKQIQANFKYNRSPARRWTFRTLGSRLQIGDLLGDQTKFKCIYEDQALAERILAQTAPEIHAAGSDLTRDGLIKVLILDLQIREHLKSPPMVHSRLDVDRGREAKDIVFGLTPRPFKPIPIIDQVYTLEQLMRLRPALDLTGKVSLFDPTKTGKPGGYAMAYRGEYLGKTVAIKVLRFPRSRNKHKPYEYERLLERRTAREINVWAALSHPHILHFHGFTTEHGDFPSMVSPWCDHGSALDYMRCEEVSREERFQLTQQVACGLHYLHDLKIVHGDLNPRNVLIDSQRSALLADFGLVRLEAYGIESSSPYSGTLRYTAPELVVTPINRLPKATKEGDIWAFGCVALEFLEQIEPYRNIPQGLLKETVIGGRKPAAQGDGFLVAAGADSSLWTLLNACWSLDPRERPSIMEIRNYLDAVAGNLGFPKLSWKDEVMARMSNC